MIKKAYCNICGHSFFVYPRPHTKQHIQCDKCNTYIGIIETHVISSYSGDTFLKTDVSTISEHGDILDYMLGSGAPYHSYSEYGSEAEAEESAVTGPTTKLTAKYCRHCGEEIPDMLDDSARWCSYCGGDTTR